MKNEINEKLLSGIAKPEGLEEELYKKCRARKHTREVAIRRAGVLAAFLIAGGGLCGHYGIRWMERSRVSSDTQAVDGMHTSTLLTMMDPEIVANTGAANFYAGPSVMNSVAVDYNTEEYNAVKESGFANVI
ncbi:MAG: hypothetical protein J6M27_05230, partial [Lachnospiraceae bacterium]|nr:hypothetical protein [Lachnospiraceae bacterium]